MTEPRDTNVRISQPTSTARWTRSLLDVVVGDSVEPSYRAAAQRRAALGTAAPKRVGTSRAVTVASILLIGFVLAVAALQARAQELPSEQNRRAIGEEIERRAANTDELRRQNQLLRAEIDERGRAALLLGAGADDGQSLLETLSRLETQAGVSAVEGPGVVITIDDTASTPDADSLDPRAGETADASQRVLDRDLQGLVNGLWAAGAEAIAVGDYRLTSVSAIRAAGEAILVDYRPLLPPYTVRAIGNQEDLEFAVNAGAAGQRLRALRDTAGVRLSIDSEDSMQVPEAQGISLRNARIPASGGTTPGPFLTSSGSGS